MQFSHFRFTADLQGCLPGKSLCARSSDENLEKLYITVKLINKFG